MGAPDTPPSWPKQLPAMAAHHGAGGGVLQALCAEGLPSHMSSGELWGPGGQCSRGLLHPIPGVWGLGLRVGASCGVTPCLTCRILASWPSGLPAQSQVLRGPYDLGEPLRGCMQMFWGQ